MPLTSRDEFFSECVGELVLVSFEVARAASVNHPKGRRPADHWTKLLLFIIAVTPWLEIWKAGICGNAKALQIDFLDTDSILVARFRNNVDAMYAVVRSELAVHPFFSALSRSFRALSAIGLSTIRPFTAMAPLCCASA